MDEHCDTRCTAVQCSPDCRHVLSPCLWVIFLLQSTPRPPVASSNVQDVQTLTFLVLRHAWVCVDAACVTQLRKDCEHIQCVGKQQDN